MVKSFHALSLAICCAASAAYSPMICLKVRPSRTTALYNGRTTYGESVDLPDVTDIFDKIQKVSPLARTVIETHSSSRESATSDPALKWKTVESNKKSSVQHIQKLDKFAGISTPVFRFQSKLQGPCLGDFFGRFIIDLEERRKWDAQIEQVHEIHSVENLHEACHSMGLSRYGECARLGIGYGQTKAAFGISPREQMFLYGLQEFPDGSSLIWGTEMAEEYDHLFPDGQRHTRAKSHLFSATLKPTGKDSFDVEYVLQLDIGGKIPTWLTTPVLIDTVKSLFDTAQMEFAGATDSLQKFLLEKVRQDKFNWQSLLIPI